jgi:hypothetical protein
MGSKNVVAEQDKCLIGAFSAFDFWFAADASGPLIPTHGRVASLSASCILPSAREHLLAPSEQVPEERNLLRCRRGRCHSRDEARGLPRRFPDLRLFDEHTQSVGDLRPFPIECAQSILQNRNFSWDVVRTGDGIMPFRKPSRLSANKRYDRTYGEYPRPRRALWFRQHVGPHTAPSFLL